jgi:hypothetical protein
LHRRAQLCDLLLLQRSPLALECSVTGASTAMGTKRLLRDSDEGSIEGKTGRISRKLGNGSGEGGPHRKRERQIGLVLGPAVTSGEGCAVSGA